MQVAFRLNVAGYPANEDREMWAAFCANVTFDLSADVLIQAGASLQALLSFELSFWSCKQQCSAKRL